MRKYYTPRAARKRCSSTRLPKKVDPWVILRTFVQSAAGYYTFDTLCDLLSACRERSVARYMEVSSYLDDQSRLYTGQEDVEQVFVHRQTIALLKKYPFVSSDLPSSPRAVAAEKWRAAEERCKDTNLRLRALQPSDTPLWVHRARNAIADVLGELDPSLVMKIINKGRHGPGSTRSSRGNRLSAFYKFADLPYTVTRRAAPYAFAAISSDPKWVEFLESTGIRRALPPYPGSSVQRELQIITQAVEFEDSDKITFVPKDCRTDRPIAVGSSLNIFLQLGVKAYLEERLKTVGVDLTDQARNQRYASLGARYHQINGQFNPRQFSTIDLASASDTISVEIVRLLLPADWFAFLSDLRHESGSLDDSIHQYEKFSAMGNGYTFPLESLIFYGICKGTHEDNGWQCTSNDIAVYGDDIIIRNYAAASCIANLEWSGFLVNNEKSFVSGPFKESCGSDFFNEHNVRPYYLKREIVTYTEVYKMANWINFKFMKSPFTKCLLPLYTMLVSQIPTECRAYGPLLEGSANFLAVSLSDMRSLEIAPFLSGSERRSLSQSGIMDWKLFDLQSPIYICTKTVAVPYKARWRVQYMLWLRYQTLVPEEKSPWDDWCDNREAVVMGNTTTRRNSVQHVITASPIPNWNQDASFLESRRSLGTIVTNS